jgi:CO/xanthine dehydrogenase FAD-binding subunit
VIRQYHRPATIDEALDLLARPGAVPLGGGTVLNGLPEPEPTEVVDLQALGLDDVAVDADTLRVGALVRLQGFAEADAIPMALRDLARREAPSTIRRAATIGGTVAAADPESELLAGLLAYDAAVTVARVDSVWSLPVGDLLTEATVLDGGIVTSVEIPRGREGAAARTGRTPADTAIVAVVGCRAADGTLRLAATGMSTTPVIVDPDALDDLDPPEDFRGSAEYRRHLAGVLGARVLAKLGAGPRLRAPRVAEDRAAPGRLLQRPVRF